MLAYQNDTIAALATPPGRGGIAIVRVSGENARAYFEALFRPAGRQQVESHRLLYGHLYDADGAMLDECMAVLMLAPRTYTREDVAEFHLHGGDQIAREALAALYRLGARPAEPGEFTRRAFLNGRVDLSRAEAVMDVIGAQGEQAARAALRQLNGGASAFIRDAQQRLTDLLAGVAAALDYPEEIEEDEAAGSVIAGARALRDTLLSACDERAARLLDTGFEAALCGRPNVGKSSLLNALLCAERAIVTDIPGTTRDAVEQTVTLGRHLLRLLDTAGIRETADRVEELGVARALQAAQTCQLALFVVDGSKPLTPEDEAAMDAALQAPEAIAILNKQDLPCVMDPSELPFAYVIPVSCAKNEGLDLLEQALDMVFDFDAPCDGSILTNARQADAIAKSRESIEAALSSLRLGMTPDAVLVDVEAAMESLGEATGRVVREDITNRIFERFCVGK